MAVARRMKASRIAVPAFTRPPRPGRRRRGRDDRRCRSSTWPEDREFESRHLVRRRGRNLAVRHMRRSKSSRLWRASGWLTAGSAGTYLSAVWWLSDLISLENESRSLGRYATGESSFHRLQLRCALSELLLAIQEFQRLLLDDFHAPFDVFFRFVRFGANFGGLRLRLGQEGPLPVQILLAGREILLPPPEFTVPIVDPGFAVPDSLLAIQELDRPSLEEFALPRQLGFLALHRLPDFLGDFARGAMGRDEALFRHRSETLAQVGHAALDLAARFVIFRGPGGGLCPLLLEDGDGVLRFLLELCDPRGSLLVTGLEIGLRGNERPSLLLERLSYFRIGFRLGLLRFLVGTRRELFRDFEGLRGSRGSFGHRVLKLGGIVGEGRQPRLLPVELLLAPAHVRRVRFEFCLQLCEGFFLRLEACVTLRESLVGIRFRFGTSRWGAVRRGREMRVRGLEEEGGPVDIVRCELAA